ncbi:hypothetical protein Tco_0448654 [Tanacetum coccineum]
MYYPPILDINYFRHFLDILRSYDPMDDEPMWAADRVVASTPGSAITIPETANEFPLKHVNAVFIRSGKSYDPPVNPNDQQNNSKTPINFDSDDEDDEPTLNLNLKIQNQSKNTVTQTIPTKKSHILQCLEEKNGGPYGKIPRNDPKPSEET